MGAPVPIAAGWPVGSDRDFETLPKRLSGSWLQKHRQSNLSRTRPLRGALQQEPGQSHVMPLILDAVYLPTRHSGQKKACLWAGGIRQKANVCWWRCVPASVSRTRIGWTSAAISRGADSGRHRSADHVDQRAEVDRVVSPGALASTSARAWWIGWSRPIPMTTSSVCCAPSNSISAKQPGRDLVTLAFSVARSPVASFLKTHYVFPKLNFLLRTTAPLYSDSSQQLLNESGPTTVA
jgi:hypothetical protein